MINKLFINKKVLVTGHTGFKGGWLTLWLNLMGAKVIGFSLPPKSDNLFFKSCNIEKYCNLFFGDICNLSKISKIISDEKPDIIIHMAAQALVNESYNDPLYTFKVNILGVANILEAIRLNQKKIIFLNITSDKCYENDNLIKNFCETDPLGGKDPYSSSKSCSELITKAYRESFFKNKHIYLATARAGNVIGGGDWSKDRLIPDLFKAFNKNHSFEIRNPDSVRPWQFVLEPLGGYLSLIEKIIMNGHVFCDAWNFGPFVKKKNHSVIDIINIMRNQWNELNKVKIKYVKPKNYEATFLSLDCKKTSSKIGWKPKLDIKQALLFTTDWYKSYFDGEDMAKFSISQIKKYNQL